MVYGCVDSDNPLLNIHHERDIRGSCHGMICDANKLLSVKLKLEIGPFYLMFYMNQCFLSAISMRLTPSSYRNFKKASFVEILISRRK